VSVIAAGLVLGASHSSMARKKEVKVYNLEKSIKNHLGFVKPDALKKAIEDMAAKWPQRFTDKEALLKKVDALSGELQGAANSVDKAREILAFQKEVLTRNPLLDFDKLLVIRHQPGSDNPFPTNWQSNANITKRKYKSEIAMISIKDPDYISAL